MNNSGNQTAENARKAMDAYEAFKVKASEPLTLENLQRLELKDDDILVVRVPCPISQDAEANIREALSFVAGGKHHVIVLQAGMELAVLGAAVMANMERKSHAEVWNKERGG